MERALEQSCTPCSVMGGGESSVRGAVGHIHWHRAGALASDLGSRREDVRRVINELRRGTGGGQTNGSNCA